MFFVETNNLFRGSISRNFERIAEWTGFFWTAANVDDPLNVIPIWISFDIHKLLIYAEAG